MDFDMNNIDEQDTVKAETVTPEPETTADTEPTLPEATMREIAAYVEDMVVHMRNELRFEVKRKNENIGDTQTRMAVALWFADEGKQDVLAACDAMRTVLTKRITAHLVKQAKTRGQGKDPGRETLADTLEKMAEAVRNTSTSASGPETAPETERSEGLDALLSKFAKKRRSLGSIFPSSYFRHSTHSSDIDLDLDDFHPFKN